MLKELLQNLIWLICLTLNDPQIPENNTLITQGIRDCSSKFKSIYVSASYYLHNTFTLIT